jgi:phosphoglycerate dehydrogenase-like enzyme
MRPLTLLVLADPAQRCLAMLERLPEDAGIVVGDCAEAFQAAAPEAEAILFWFSRRELLEAVWPTTPGLRWVHCSSAGVEHMLFPELIESDVVLTNSRGAFSPALAEFVIAAVLFFAKDLRRMVRSQAAGIWDCFDIEEAAGRALGIVGYGDIGRAVAARARALGMRVLAVRRRPEPAGDDPLVEAAYLVEALSKVLSVSDYIVVCVPLTPATLGLIGEAELRLMKSSAVLINVGRGPVVDEGALVRALEEGWIRGAALDVFDQEPLPAGHPFYRFENVLLSAHCADRTPDWQDRAMELFIENFHRFHRGAPLHNVVDKQLGY